MSVQYTGFSATHELQTFWTWDRARNLYDFRRGLQSFDVGSQNFAYADIDTATSPTSRAPRCRCARTCKPARQRAAAVVHPERPGRQRWLPVRIRSRGRRSPTRSTRRPRCRTW